MLFHVLVVQSLSLLHHVFIAWTATLFIHSFVNAHLACFQLRDVMNNVVFWGQSSDEHTECISTVSDIILSSSLHSFW